MIDLAVVIHDSEVKDNEYLRECIVLLPSFYVDLIQNEKFKDLASEPLAFGGLDFDYADDEKTEEFKFIIYTSFKENIVKFKTYLHHLFFKKTFGRFIDTTDEHSYEENFQVSLNPDLASKYYLTLKRCSESGDFVELISFVERKLGPSY